MEETNDQIAQRLKKLEALQGAGVAPYGARFEGKHPLSEILKRHRDSEKEALEADPPTYRVAGRLVSLRRFGKAAFSNLQDVTGRLQVYFKKEYLGEAAFGLFEALDLGDHVGLEGVLFRTKTHELTLQVRQLTLLSKALRPLPEKWHGLTDIELRYRRRYVDLIANPEVREVFVQRGKAIEAMRRFLSGQGFLEVETPMMHAIAGGATARPFVTHHNTLGMDLYLRIAPELYLKRLIVGGFERIFEINRNFRNEGISTIHNPEFTMLEFYMAYADYHDLIPFTERLITTVAQEVCGGLTLTYQGKAIDLTPPWKQISYLDALSQRHQISPDQISDLNLLRDLAKSHHLPVKETDGIASLWDALFSATVEPDLTGPVFVTHHPTAISPLAKRMPGCPDLTERFELYIASREIANGFSELNDPQDQRRRFESQMAERDKGDLEAHAMDEDYLMALEVGLPPTAGEGIGIDRLVMLLTDQASIRDVIFFPQMRPEK